MDGDRVRGLWSAGGEMEICECATSYKNTQEGQHQTRFERSEQGTQADSFQRVRRGLSRDFLQ
jgi:hypothetical protein